jgi:hypothetical protein
MQMPNEHKNRSARFYDGDCGLRTGKLVEEVKISARKRTMPKAFDT